jgi:uncharacterized RDD family membrane protein YckC
MTQPQPAATPYGPGYGAQATTQLAGFWRRLVAYIIDAVIVGIASGIVERIIAAIVRSTGADTTGIGVRGGLISLIIGLLYFGYLWSRNGQTVGYMAMGMRLVRADGGPITFVLGAVRYFLIYLSFALCLIPAIISAFMIGLGGRKQAIHDLIVGTLVFRG